MALSPPDDLVTLDENAVASLRKLIRPGRPNPLVRLAQTYVDTAPEVIDRIGNGMRTGELYDVFEASHRLKSITAQLGGLALARALEALELAAESNREAEANEAYQGVLALWEPTLDAIGGLRNEAPTTTAPPSSSKAPDVGLSACPPSEADPNVGSPGTSPTRARVPSTELRALIIDDDDALRSLVAEALRDLSFEVSEAGSGQDGVAAYRHINPDIILLDVIMPGMNGYETCQALRGLEGGQHVPILMMTGRDDGRSVADAYDAGATDFIAKPLNFDIFSQRVRYIMRSANIEQRLRENQTLLHEAQRVAQLGYFVHSAKRDHQRWSEEIPRLLGVTAERFAGNFDAYLEAVHSDDRETVSRALELARGRTVPHTEAHRILRPNGEVRHIMLTAKADPGADSDPTRVLATVQDVTEQHQREARIVQLSHFDDLTGLSNRSLFEEQLSHTLARAERSGDTAAVLFIGLDRFQHVNVTFGRQAGDDVLRTVSERLVTLLRSAGPEATTEGSANSPILSLARAGGDEFMVAVNQLASDDVTRLADRVTETLGASIGLAETDINLTVSIGLAQATWAEAQAEKATLDGRELVRFAETAMHHAKAEGGDRYEWHSDAVAERISQRLQRTNRLRRVVDNDELELHYQPRVDLTSGNTVSVEALLRWRDPLIGMIPPLEFIPLAEETGLILPIGAWVIERACRDVANWQRDGRAVTVSINLSPVQFRAESIVSDIERALSRSSVDPSWIEFEVTESAVMEDTAAARRTMEALVEMGLRLSIDDFGTGYSSLSYLKRFPISALKIDRAFVRDLPADRDDIAIVRAIVALGKSFDLTLVAEGVETTEQAAFLAACGADEAQGYLYSKPVPEAQFLDWLAQTQT